MDEVNQPIEAEANSTDLLVETHGVQEPLTITHPSEG